MTFVKRLNLPQFMALFICSVLTGVLSGGIINAINGLVSPPYYWWFFYRSQSVDWHGLVLYRHTIGQGCLEGSWVGSVMATIFTGYVFGVSKAACSFRFAAPYLLKMAGINLLFWCSGGLGGVILSLMFPQMLNVITYLGGTHIEQLKFLWVQCSLYGVYIGSLFSLIYGCHLFRRDWYRQQKSMQ